MHRNYSMYSSTDILSIARKQPVMQHDLEMLLHVDKDIRGSVHYTITRYKKEPQWNIDDTGILEYHFVKNDPAENYLELKFCVTGNIYCRQKQTECDFCKFNASRSCVEKVESIDVISFSFKPSYLNQFAKTNSKTISEAVLS
ncbi:MAG TPA: hypothetical protein VKH37_14065, partial [Ferruginibacter sp.]|nr:hypothetical protein [Ferruginibacter sp.]